MTQASINDSQITDLPKPATKKVSRSSASMTLLIAFIGLLISAGLMIALPYSAAISTAHITFSMLFVAAIGLHLANNLTAVFKYWFKKKSMLLPYTLMFVTAIGAGALMQFTPFKQMYELEQVSKLQGKTRDMQDMLQYDLLRYQASHGELNLGKQDGATRLNINASLATALRTHMMAVWLEDKQGNMVEPLTLSYKGAKKLLPHGAALLPHFYRSFEPESAEVQALEFAKTKAANAPFVLSTSSDLALQDLVLKMEVNVLGDGNDTYPAARRGAWPERDGQPSIVYSANLDQEIQWINYQGVTNAAGEVSKAKGLTSITEHFNQLLLEVVNNKVE